VNYTAGCVVENRRAHGASRIAPRIMIDFSHANSQGLSPQALSATRGRANRPGNRNIIGVMIESNLVAGAQKLVPGQLSSTAKASPTPASTEGNAHASRRTRRRRPLPAQRKIV